MSYSDEFVREFIEMPWFDPRDIESALQRIQVSLGMQRYKYRRWPLDQRPKIGSAETDEEIDLLKRALKMYEEKKSGTTKH